MVLIDYDDEIGWPLSPGGQGNSLVMIDPTANPNHPANWRANANINGFPGTDS